MNIGASPLLFIALNLRAGKAPGWPTLGYSRRVTASSFIEARAFLRMKCCTETLLRSELGKKNDFTVCISQSNACLCDINIPYMFVTLIVMVIDLTNGKATYVNAGHLPLLASLGGRPRIDIDAPAGLIAGVLDDTVYEAGKLTLRPGDSLALYIDGVTEARDDDRVFFT